MLVILACAVMFILVAAAFAKGFWAQYEENRAASDSAATSNLDPTGELLPTQAQSFRVTRDHGDGNIITTSVDWTSQNSIIVDNDTELRTIDGRGYARESAGGEWIEVDPVASEYLRLFPTEFVIGDMLKPFVLESSPTVHGGGRYVIDTATFAASDAEYWRAWAVFFTDVERVPAAGETATVEVVGLADGVLQTAIVTFLPSGEAMSYTLTDISESPLVVDLS